MEFKVFKNENSKILKEYWLTPSEWDALDKATVQEGDIYHIVGTIDKGDLSADVNASLAKADSSLQKPTATLAKESFVKVGIDGTQKFDDTVVTIDTLNTFEAKLNENIIKDPDKTYLVWKGASFPNSSYAAFKAPAGCTIDWGDGNVETFETASTVVNTHTYSDGIEYHLISLSNYTVIDNGAFESCIGLTSITIPDSVTSIGNAAFKDCSGLTSVTIGNGVTSLGNSAFYNCSGLNSVIIGNGVTIIEDYAFESCRGLTSVTIPDSVTSIGKKAFWECSKLKTIEISSATPSSPLGSNAFDTSIEKIIVPKSAINTYKSASGWSTYADKIVYEVDSSDISDTSNFAKIDGDNTFTGSNTFNKHISLQYGPEGYIDLGNNWKFFGFYLKNGTDTSLSFPSGKDGTIALTSDIPEANPTAAGTVILTKLKIGDTVYNLPSGGGKYYLHDVTIRNNSEIELPIVKFKYISTDNNTFSLDKFNFHKCFDVYANNNSTPPKFYQVKDMSTDADSITITYYTTYPFDVMSTATLPVKKADIHTNDNVFEL